LAFAGTTGQEYQRKLEIATASRRKRWIVIDRQRREGRECEKDGARNCTVYAIKIVASEFSSIVAASKKKIESLKEENKNGRLQPCQAGFVLHFVIFHPRPSSIVLAVRVLAAATS